MIRYRKNAGSMTNRTELGKGREPLQRALPSARFYDVGRRQLMLYASGTGAPGVVFLPGAGVTGLGYLNLHEQASRFTTSVLYDRAGTGWSDHAELPRSATEVTDELRSLLHVAGVPAPYVFVGHSLGGLYARRFAQRFSADVAGLVFLDPAHEDYTTKSPKPSLLERLRTSLALFWVLLRFRRLYRGYFERMFAGWPAPVRDLLFEYHRRSWRVGLEEAKNFKNMWRGAPPRRGHARCPVDCAHRHGHRSISGHVRDRGLAAPVERHQVGHQPGYCEFCAPR